jgi:glycosyltransferase involved in cell wall biosynthesis
LRLGVVAAELEGEATGVGRYLEGLLGGLDEVAPPSWSIHLFLQGPRFEHPLFARSRLEPHFGGDAGRRFVPRRRVVWEQILLPAQMRCFDLDVVFSPSYSLPPRLTVPALVTIHDLSFEVLPAGLGWRERWRRRLLARRACERARRILVDTEATRDELVARYRLSRSKVGVVPIAVGEAFAAAPRPEDGAMRERLGVTSPYLLFVGALFERRQPRLMLETLHELRRDDPTLRLVLAGPNRLRQPERMTRWIAELGLAEAVDVLGYVPDAALAPLYRGAKALLYLSIYEGYGLPPLEALACGTPAVVGRGLALDHLWPGYPGRAEELSLEHVLVAARRALCAEVRDTIRAQAFHDLRHLTWPDCARKFVTEVQLALDGEARGGRSPK